jgi:uncharacterized protein (DUF427 family)
MSLTIGIGPFAKPRRGQLNTDLSNAPKHLLYVHELGRHVRGELAGQSIVDSDGVVMLHETGLLPQWYFPLADIRPDVLVESDHKTHCPYKGDARYWHVRVGDRLVENAVWNYPAPLPGAPDIAGLAGFYFDRIDAWYEEDEKLLGHPRDPFHRVDTRASRRRVTVKVDGRTIADTNSPVALFETGLPVRWYVPRADIDRNALSESEKHTVCPYKGTASYVSAGDHADIGWTYPDPLGEALAIADHYSFDGKGVEVSVGRYE